MSALRKTQQRPRNYVHTGIRDGRIVLLKVCSGPCGEEKLCADGPESGFWPGKGPDGKQRWQAYCKACALEINRDYQREQAERINARRRRRYRERIATDPEYLAYKRADSRASHLRWLEKSGSAEKMAAATRAYQRRRREADPEGVRELGRMNYVLRREREGKTVRHRTDVVGPIGPRVLAEPFRRYLWAYRRASGLWGNYVLAAALGIESARVRCVLGGQRRVTLSVVDRALLRAEILVWVDGRLILGVEDLYPLSEGLD